MTASKCLGWRFAAVALMAGAMIQTAGAAPFLQTQINTFAESRGEINGPSATDTQPRNSFTGALLSSSSFAQMSSSTASADAIASPGFLRVQAFNTFPAFQDGDASAIASSLWADGFLIDIPGHTGELAHLTASALVDGFADVVGDGRARIDLGARRDGVTVAGISELFLANGPQFGGGVPPVMNLAFFFTVGTPFELTMSMGVVVDRADLGPGAADINFFDTAVWNGISAVTVGGNTVETYGFSSLSGLDYRQSFATVIPPPPANVAEPNSLLSALAGLALVGLRVGRRATRQPASKRADSAEPMGAAST